MSVRVLVATDLEPTSRQVLDWVRRQLKPAALRLVHVVDDFGLYLHATPMSPLLRMEPQVVEREILERDAQARETLSSWVLPGLETWEVRHGDPAEQIIRAALDWSADLIAMGVRGRGFVGDLLHPPLARRVTRESPVPVLALPVAHPPQGQPLAPNGGNLWYGGF